jgi:ABC-type nitrate/sulfonate/bicarbonate transport system substrate-binding protein
VAPSPFKLPMMIWHVNSRWAKNNEKLLLGFTRAHNKAVRYLLDPANKSEVAQMLAQASRSSIEDALKTWDVCSEVKGFIADGSISEKAVERVRDTLMASGDLKPPALPASAYYDDHYVSAAAQEESKRQ